MAISLSSVRPSEQPSEQPPEQSSEQSSEQFGIALIGTGFGQKVHLPAVRNTTQGTVVALYHRDLSKAQAIAQQHQIPQASDSLSEILAMPEVQGVSISSPPFLHFAMAQQVLHAKKHLFLEKPMAMNVTEAKALWTMSQAQQCTTALNFEFRFVPAWMQLKALLDQGYIGNKRLIKIDWLVPGRADSQRPWSWHVSDALGGGSLGALCSHTFDYITWLFGPIQCLNARLITTIKERPDAITGELKLADADDTCVLLMELADQTLCQISISCTTFNGRGHWVEVYGDRATLILGSDHPSDYVHGFQLRGSQNGAPLKPMDIDPAFEFPKTHSDGRIAPVTRVFEAWMMAAREHTPLRPGLKEGVYTQLLMDLARQSHQQNAWVEVPSLEAVLK